MCGAGVRPGWRGSASSAPVYSVASRGRALRRHHEAGVRHAQRIEDALAQEVIEALAGQHLDQPRHDVGGNRVLPRHARMRAQRQLAQQLHRLGQRLAGVEHLALLVRREHRRAGIEEAVTEAGAVAQQMAHGDRPCRRFGVRQIAGADAQDPPPTQRRDVALDRIVQLKAARPEQQQRRARGDQLGVGEHAEEVIGLQAQAAFAVGPADAMKVEAIASLEQGKADARQHVLVYAALQHGMGAAEIVAASVDCQFLHAALSGASAPGASAAILTAAAGRGWQPAGLAGRPDAAGIFSGGGRADGRMMAPEAAQTARSSRRNQETTR